MRTIIVGLGAIGGVLAAALARSGQEVIAVARGPMLEAVRADGLRFITPEIDEAVALSVVGAPQEIAFRQDDTVMICVKTQHTEAALLSLRDAGVTEQPIVCMQNGIANEPLALRYFANVHGVAVRLPCAYTIPGEVSLFIAPSFGVLDIGRYPSGLDVADQVLADALTRANFDCVVDHDVMASKRGKLINNINNILAAAMRPDADVTPWQDALRAEAIAVYQAAGLSWCDFGKTYPDRRDLLKMREVAGQLRSGGSTYQSLERGTGNLETEYLNGEIVLLGRLHSVPTPVNAAMCALAADLVRSEAEPGTLRAEDLPPL